MKALAAPSDAPVRFDALLLCAVLSLVSLGLVMVYSASAVMAQDKLGDSLYFLNRQLVAAGLGVVAMAVGMKVGWRRLARLAYPLLLVTLVLLVLVLIPGIGTTAGGARRWIRLPGFGLQPAEVAKVAWVVYLSYSLAKKREKVATFSVGFLPHLVLCGLLVGLCMLQPDFGSSVLLVFLLFALLFAAGTKVSYLVGSVLLALPLAYAAIASSPYRMKRVLAFLDPWAHRHDIGYQVAESLMSIGSGGLTGLGLGDGRQKLFFLPEAHTDFIFAIIGEELGLMGVVLLVSLYAIVIWRGIRASLAAPETFGTYLGLGLT
jgi:cell division protein FtsW